MPTCPWTYVVQHQYIIFINLKYIYDFIEKGFIFIFDKLNLGVN